MVARGDHAGALDLLVKDLTRYQQGDAEPRELLLACRARIQCAQIRGFISSSQITPELLADADSGVARAARGKQETLLWVEQLRQLAALAQRSQEQTAEGTRIREAIDKAASELNVFVRLQAMLRIAPSSESLAQEELTRAISLSREQVRQTVLAALEKSQLELASIRKQADARH